MNKKGFAIGDLLPIGITFVVVAIAVGLGAQILAQIQTSQLSAGATTIASNISGQGLTSLGTIGQYLPTVALVAVVSVIIGVVVMYLARKM